MSASGINSEVLSLVQLVVVSLVTSAVTLLLNVATACNWMSQFSGTAVAVKLGHGVGVAVGGGVALTVTVGRGVGGGGAPWHIETDVIEPVGGAGVMPGALTHVPVPETSSPN